MNHDSITLGAPSCDATGNHLPPSGSVAPISTPLGGAPIYLTDKQICSYCGNLDFSVGAKSLKKYTNQHRFVLSVPICGRCFLQIKNKKTPVKSTIDEHKLVEKAATIKSAAHGLSNKTPMHRIKALCDELDGMAHCLHLAVNDFDMKAREAEQAARKVEWLRVAIESAKLMVGKKLNSSYENCRKLANKFISDPDVRNFIFTRDGCVCVKCGGEQHLSIDHIKPVVAGGTNDYGNLQTLCLPCNLSKGSKYSK